MKTKTQMIPFEKTFEIIEEKIDWRFESTEEMPTEKSVGRVLAKAEKSMLDMPPFDKSAVDGYAVLFDDKRDSYLLLEEVQAGSVPTKELVKGTATKVMTGAPVPKGAGKVIMVEYTEQLDDMIAVFRHSEMTNISKKGENLKKGDEILYAGRVLTSVDVANLVSCGVKTVTVSRKPKIAVISTGNEIVDNPEDITPGKIMNSNSSMICCMAESHGLEVAMSVNVSDDKEETVDTVKKALDAADIVVLSGGVSMGDFDFVMPAIESAGLNIHFSRLAVKPGKPVVFASGSKSGSKKIVFGLPGNPVSVFISFNFYAMHAVDVLTGAKRKRTVMKFKLAADFKRRLWERMEFVPCVLNSDMELEAIRYHGSGHLSALSEADGFFVVPAGINSIEKGKEAAFYPLKRGLL